MKKSVGIVGCGWLGKPLAETLKTSFEVECFCRNTTDDGSSFWQRDFIIISIHTKDNYLQSVQKINRLVPLTSTIILMSSTSVYREFECEVDENADIEKLSLQKEVEDLLLCSRERVLILRLGGLMGEDRIAGKWSKASTFEDGFVNYVHRDDVIGVVKLLLENKPQHKIYNVVAPMHPTRKEVHTRNSQKLGLQLGNFTGFSHRIVHSKTLEDEFKYKFIHPNPLNFWG
ncbi:MAG: hypothetical protein QG559_696 [Campylobacterota bacterium]|nr:hypothetical protein [Campylobacterota bacterium]